MAQIKDWSPILERLEKTCTVGTWEGIVRKGGTIRA